MQLPYFLNQPAKAFELAAFLPSVSELRLKSPLVQGFANLEQFGASQRQHAQNCSGSTELWARSPKRTPVSFSRRQTWAAPYSSSQGTLAPKAAFDFCRDSLKIAVSLLLSGGTEARPFFFHSWSRGGNFRCGAGALVLESCFKKDTEIERVSQDRLADAGSQGKGNCASLAAAFFVRLCIWQIVITEHDPRCRIGD